jgi:hypothetical protein
MGSRLSPVLKFRFFPKKERRKKERKEKKRKEKNNIHYDTSEQKLFIN